MVRPKRPWRFVLVAWLAIFILASEAHLFALTIGPWVSRTFGLFSFWPALVFGTCLTITLFLIAVVIAWGVVSGISRVQRLFKAKNPN